MNTLLSCICRALQRPGLVTAASAMVPAAALNIAAAVVLERAHHRHDASALALCTGPAAVHFVVTRTYSSGGSRGNDGGASGSSDSGGRGTKVRCGYLAACTLSAALQSDMRRLDADAAAAPQPQRLEFLTAAVRLLAWLCLQPGIALEPSDAVMFR